MSFTVAIVNGKAPSGGTGGVSDADLSNFAVDFLTAGALGVGDFLVSYQASPNKTVQVATGVLYVRNAGSTMVYRVKSDAIATSPVFTNNTSGNPRIDAVALKIDLGTTPNNLANNIVSIVVVAGTPGVSPVAPSDATIQTAVGAGNVFYRLKEYTIPTGYTQIDNTTVNTDKRTFSGIGTPALLDSAITQAKAPFALAGSTINMKMQIMNSVPGWNGLGAGAGASQTITFTNMTDVYFAWAMPVNGGGGSTGNRLTIFANNTNNGGVMGPGFSNVVLFAVFNNGSVPAYVATMSYMAVGI